MISTLGELFPQIMVMILNPIPIMAVVLVLLSKQPRENGAAFALGWLLGFAGLGLLALRLLQLLLQHGPGRFPQHVGRDRSQLDVRPLEHLLEPVHHRGAFLDERDALAGQVAQVTLGRGRDEACAQQAVGQQFGDPSGRPAGRMPSVEETDVRAWPLTRRIPVRCAAQHPGPSIAQARGTTDLPTLIHSTGVRMEYTPISSRRCAPGAWGSIGDPAKKKGAPLGRP